MIKEKIKKIIKKNVAAKVNFNIEIPSQKDYGDYSTNVAFLLGKILNKNHKDIADEIIKRIGESELFEKIKNQNGFINFYLKPEWLQKQVEEIIKFEESFGKNNEGQSKKIQIEFISANPTGPLTIGNSRGGIIGDMLANVFENCSWQVTREYYFNDAGGQIDALGHSVLKDEKAEYVGDYIDKLNQEFRKRYQKLIKEKDYRKIGQLAAQEIIKEIKKTCRRMGIKFDVWFAEGKDLREKGKIKEIINWLDSKNLIYRKDGAVWFKSTQFGDDKDRVLIKKDGEPTYFGVDCAYHKNKFVDRKFDKVINIWGADHHGDVKRIKGFIKALGYEKKFDIILHQFVSVIEDGKEVRMSKRKGNYILVDDLLKAIGRDVFRFFMLQYSPNSHLTLDLNLAKEKSEKNPVYYVQYAYARLHSILAKFKIQNKGLATNSKLEPKCLKLLRKKEELDLIKELIKYPDLIKETSRDYQVQRFAAYLMDLAAAFHNFYEKCRIIGEDKKISNARLLLLYATKIVLKNCLDLIGVSALEKM